MNFVKNWKKFRQYFGKIPYLTLWKNVDRNSKGVKNRRFGENSNFRSKFEIFKVKIGFNFPKRLLGSKDFRTFGGLWD